MKNRASFRSPVYEHNRSHPAVATSHSPAAQFALEAKPPRLTTWLQGVKVRDLSSAPVDRAILETRCWGIKLQICRRMLNLERAGAILSLFIPAVWQEHARSSSPFPQILWDDCENRLDGAQVLRWTNYGCGVTNNCRTLKKCINPVQECWCSRQCSSG
jgi:hypothetical protein